MKIIYEFDGHDQDDHYQRKLIETGPDMASALHDIDDMCRNKIKYEQDVSDDVYTFAEEIRTVIWESGLSELP